jgi:hypothetical protein
LLVSIAISMLFRPQTDMRGGVAADASGMAQVQGIIVINLTIAFWLAQVLFTQVFPM